jgi:hypothetical protein
MRRRCSNQMPPRTLFAWVASENMPVGLCVYEDPADLPGPVWTIVFEVEDLRRLAGDATQR